LPADPHARCRPQNNNANDNGTGARQPRDQSEKITEATLRWNRAAVDTSGLDHSPVTQGEARTFGHHLGPTRSSRAMAIVHIAMFEAANATQGQYKSYTQALRDDFDADAAAAIAQAARDTLVALYPSHAARLNDELAADLAQIPDSIAKTRGILLGQKAAAAILAMRENDGSEIAEPYVVSDEPGAWRPDPINPDQEPLGEEWYRVKPFVMNSVTQFRCPPPPALDSDEYTAAYNEVLALGGDGVTTPTIRTEEQTQIGIYWAYDGTPSLCAPPRLYNQLAAQLGVDEGLQGLELLRMLAIANVAMADACIASWESKYHYNFWRPVTGIREAAPGTGPTGLGDGNPNTVGDPTFVPLCAPATNLTAPNFTPPFPSYPSGHATFGGALFQILREQFGTDDVAFTFVSDEFNGVTKDNEGNVRPLIPRSFQSLSQAEEENGQSRIYLGIHWSFDKTAGIEQGRKVGTHAYRHLFQPR
jgi:hypothetical protein